jgi:secreted Zn-dependent insulinase-like peptidase
LLPLRERAAKAGVTLQFETCGMYWQLRCAGLPETVVAVTREALKTLQHPGPSSWTAKPASETDSMPIRVLLRQLPEQIIGSNEAPLPACTPGQSDLKAVWKQARWQAMATGFSESTQHALNAALQNVPGRPGTHQPVAAQPVRRWQVLHPLASEQALLLFCPVAITEEASARLLAQHIQGPFYQRLRVELQLGYAVFSAFRQIQGVSGLLFGVQSPSASHAQILAHIEDFLTALPTTLSDSPDVRQALAEQISEAEMSNADVAEWAWQAQLAGRSQATLIDLQAKILAIDDATLRQSAEALLHAKRGWLILANGPAVEGSTWVTA